jgi:hypothetical protein
MGTVCIKSGVKFDIIAPAGARILEVLKQLAPLLTYDITITSGTDGKHSGPTDPHKLGEAYDLRTNGLTGEQVYGMLHAIKSALGARFFAFLEGAGTTNAHLHVQRRKGTTYTIDDYLANA